jgi:hypothetical protein
MDVALQPYFVPVRTAGNADTLVVQTGRLPQGRRVGIAFTGSDRLAAAMGESQQWTRLSESALRAMLTPLGVNRIQVDPILVGPEIPPSQLNATARRQPARSKPAQRQPARIRPASGAAASEDTVTERVPVTAGGHRG